MPDSRLDAFKSPWKCIQGLAVYHVCNTTLPSARILFSHGNGLTAATYQDLVFELSKSYEVIAYDSRNHGLSVPFESLRRVENTEAFADDQFMLANWLRQQSDSPLHLVVHSINAIAATRGMNRDTKPFDSVALLDPVYLGTKISLMLALSKPLGLAVRYHPLARSALNRRRKWPSYQAAEDYLIGRKALANWPLTAVESYIYSAIGKNENDDVTLNCTPERESRFFTTIPARYLHRSGGSQSPCLVLRGETGATHPVRLQQIEKRHGNMQSQTMVGHDHFGCITHPLETASAVSDFIQSLD